ncbi:TadG family pilus assembly protein [Pararobbsia silviterrae]|uniref:DUF2134 domain-containing protein n=1 Tax=Pararobbsia silviterrae TaxID=1792498 RepID=A0A494XQ81_9BURK|nr:TadG family pilus assembly protein [Pararobbsia silviterrae]RKP50264.1 hypothetical protein D7S86_19290 [Pararobbsia silviterrae]
MNFKPQTRRLAAASRMRGAIAITAAIWLSTIVVALCVIDVGHVWWERRALQGVADMMALSAAQRLDDTCGGTQSVAAQIAASNGYTGTYTVTCGRFETGSSTFTEQGSPYTTVNAIQVLLNSTVKYWFMPMIGSLSEGVAVQSTSRVVNVNAFTLGTSLLAVQTGNSALLNGLLTSLLGSSVNLGIASYQALADAQIKLGDLAAQVNSNGANDIVQMLASSPTLGTLLSAVSHVLPAGDASQTALSGLSSAATAGGSGNKVPMDGSNGQTGLLDVGLENKNAAANATIDALDAVMVAAMVAHTTGNGVAPIGLSVSLLPTIAGIDLSQSQLSVSLGQPPVLAVGEAGTASTIARSSQIKLYLDLQLSTQSPNDPLGLILANLTVEVPLYLAIGNGQATLTKTQCGSGVNDSSAQMSVQPSILQACITTQQSALNLFNAAPIGPAPSCTGAVTLVSLSLLNLGITPATPPTLSITSQSAYASAQPASSTVTFTGVGTDIVSANPVAANSNDLGQDLASVLGGQSGGVLGQLVAGLQLKISGLGALGGLLSAVISTTLSTVLGPAVQLLVQNVLTTTVESLLSTTIPPLLNALGAQIGSATVTDLSLTCGNVELVQ